MAGDGNTLGVAMFSFLKTCDVLHPYNMGPLLVMNGVATPIDGLIDTPL